MTFKLDSSILISILVISVLCFTTESYAALSSDSFPRRSSLRTLNPIRRDTNNFKRAPSTESLLPRSLVILHYGYDVIDPTQVSITVQAHQERPIILLEALDTTFIHSVACESYSDLGSITLTLYSEEIAQAAASAWAANNDTTLNLITSHVGCNPANERGAWSVSSIETHGRTVVLMVSPLRLWEIGKSFDVSLRHSGLSGEWNPRAHSLERRMTATLERRDFENELTVPLEDDHSGEEIFPSNASSMGLASDVIQDLTGANTTITCADCATHANYSAGVDFTFVPGQNITGALIFSSVLDFDQTVLLDIKVAKELQKNFAFDLVKIPVDGFEVPNLFSIGPSVGITAEFNLTISAAVDFTLGANASVPVNANSSLDLINPLNSKATGWDGVTFQNAPLRINGGAPNLTIGASLEPFIEFDINVGSNQTGLTARVTQTLPAFAVDFLSLSNVNSACAPAGDNDFSFFGIAYQVDASVTLVTSGNVQVKDLPILQSVGFNPAPSWGATLFSKTFQLLGGNQANTTGSCFIVADDGGNSNETNSAPTPTTSQHPAATGTLLSAPSAIPTYNISKIQTYYDSHGKTYPPGITFQMLAGSGQQLPAELQPAPSSGTSTSPGSPSRGKMDISSIAFIFALTFVVKLI